MEPSSIVVTGIGIVSSAAHSAQTWFDAIVRASSFATALPDPLAHATGIRRAAILSEADCDGAQDARELRRTPRFARLIRRAARRARDDAGLAPGHYDPARIACLTGSALNGVDEIAATCARFASGGSASVTPFDLLHSINSIAAGLVAIDLDAQGACFSVAAGWSGAALALVKACELLAWGTVDAVVVGGGESIQSAFTLRALAQSGLFAGSQAHAADACRAFDPGSAGSVAAEGAALFVLERWEGALQRGARVYAEMAGFGEGYALTEDPDERTRAMCCSVKGALTSARLAPEQVDCVSASASGSRVEDACERAALASTLNAPRRGLCVSASAAIGGHALGAAGAFSLALGALSLARGSAPPSVPFCGQDSHDGTQPRPMVALANCFAASGECVTFAMRAAP